MAPESYTWLYQLGFCDAAPVMWVAVGNGASYFDFVSRFASRRRFQLYQSPAAPTAAAAIRSHVVIALTSFHGV
jgi:hypothetical protein